MNAKTSLLVGATATALLIAGLTALEPKAPGSRRDLLWRHVDKTCGYQDAREGTCAVENAEGGDPGFIPGGEGVPRQRSGFRFRIP